MRTAAVFLLFLCTYWDSACAESPHKSSDKPAVVQKGASSKLASPNDPIPFPPFKMYEGRLNEDGFPTTTARLCILKTDVCYDFAQRRNAKQYPLGMNPEVHEVKLTLGATLELFSATFSAGGSGSITGVALLKYQRNGQLLDLTPTLNRSNQSDLKVWNVSGVSSWPVLAMADYKWMDGESHFASHFYTVRAYLFDKGSNTYVCRLSYVTVRKYPGLDKLDQVTVLNPEKAVILHRLKAH